MPRTDLRDGCASVTEDIRTSAHALQAEGGRAVAGITGKINLYVAIGKDDASNRGLSAGSAIRRPGQGKTINAECGARARTGRRRKGGDSNPNVRGKIVGICAQIVSLSRCSEGA